jgi:mono/diheme cytochrome c family protein
MAIFRAFWLVALTGIVALVPAARAVSTNLVFDATTKEFASKIGERTAEFDFSVTNTGPVDVTINAVRASCGCTTPKLPALPWKLQPSESGSFHVTIDLAGKFGTFQKSIFMDTTEGPKMVYVKVVMPITAGAQMASPANVDARTRNMQMAVVDPQSIFRGDCANCHSKPTLGKKGEELFTAACAICHESDQRALLVPDLQALKQKPTRAYWEAWVRNGKVGSMMPAFALDKQGPLSEEQIGSLVDYLATDFATRKPHAPDLHMVNVAVPSRTVTVNGAPIVAAVGSSANRFPQPQPQPQPVQGSSLPPQVELPGNLPLLGPVPSAPISSTPAPVPPSK